VTADTREDPNSLNTSRCGGLECPGRHSILDSGMTYEEIRRRESGREPCLNRNPAPHAPKRRAHRPGMTLDQFKADDAAYRAALTAWQRRIRQGDQPRRIRQVDGDLWSDYDRQDAAGFDVDQPEHDPEDYLWDTD